jgi:spermidine synthase
MKVCLGIAILTMGISGLVAQMLLLRELLIVFSGNELSIGLVLANWLILEAFGCFFLGKRVEKVKNKIETFIGLTILFSLSLLVAVYFTRILKNILGVSVGEGVGFFPMLYSSFLILLLVSVSHGALFTFSCKVYSMFFSPDASSIGKVYVYETMGTIVGGIIWTYLFIPYFHSFQIGAWLAMLNFLVGLILIAPNWKRGKLQKTVTVISCLFLFFGGYLVFAGGADKLHQLSIRTQWKGHNVVHYQNSIYGNICVVESEGQYIFFLDGLPQIITPIPDIGFVEEFVHLPLLAHPDPKKLLILSGGAGGVINEVLKHPQVELVEYVELDPLLLELIRKFPTPLTEEELTDRRVEVKHIDGRLFLKMTQNKYDLILVGLQDPSDLQTNRFFTREFFSIAKKRLSEEGILVIGVLGSLTYLSDEIKNLNACIFNTLKNVFPYVRVFPGDGLNLFLSSRSKGVFLLDEEQIVDRLSERGIKASVPIARHILKKLHPGWQEWFLRFLEESTQKINRDFQPLGMFYSVAYWNALFSPYLRGLFRWFETISLRLILLIFIIFIVLFWLGRTKNVRVFGSGIPFCIATTGFAGIIFDLALIFTFQSIYGYVFSWIGLLVTAFMAGAACGAMSMTALLSRIKDCLKSFIKVDLTIICFSLGLPFIFLMLHPYLGSPEVFPILKILFLVISFIGGFLIGAQFPLANQVYLKYERSLSKTAGMLYSSDLLGGWLGGIVGSVVLLPVLGLLGSCVVVVLLKLSSFVVIVVRFYKPYGEISLRK